MITTCAICGEHVGRSRIEGFKGWEGPEGEVEGREVVVAMHPECYMRLSPDARAALLADARAASDDERGAAPSPRA